MSPLSIVLRGGADGDRLVEIIDEAIATIQRADAGHVVPAVRDSGHRAVATGAWLGSSTCIIHRVATITKVPPPPDPFRAIQPDPKRNDWMLAKDDREIPRREIVVRNASREETSIVLNAMPPFALDPNDVRPLETMIDQLRMIRDTLAGGRTTTSHDAASRIATYRAVRLMEEFPDLPPIRMYASCSLPSPLMPGRMTTFPETGDGEGLAGRMRPEEGPSSWPHAMQMHLMNGTSFREDDASMGRNQTWTIGPVSDYRRCATIGTIERLRIMAEGLPTSEGWGMRTS